MRPTAGAATPAVVQGSGESRVHQTTCVAEDVSDDRVVGDAVLGENGEQLLYHLRHLVGMAQQGLARQRHHQSDVAAQGANDGCRYIDTWC